VDRRGASVLKEIFPFEVKPIDVGFKYLGSSLNQTTIQWQTGVGLRKKLKK
jgi:hypothetical protein